MKYEVVQNGNSIVSFEVDDGFRTITFKKEGITIGERIMPKSFSFISFIDGAAITGLVILLSSLVLGI